MEQERQAAAEQARLEEERRLVAEKTQLEEQQRQSKAAKEKARPYLSKQDDDRACRERSRSAVGVDPVAAKVKQSTFTAANCGQQPQGTQQHPQTTEQQPQTVVQQPQSTGQKPQTAGQQPQSTGRKPQPSAADVKKPVA